MTKAGKVVQLFSTFDNFLREQGFKAQKGQIVDGSIVKIPIQRNTRDENKQSKNGEQPEGWSQNKQRQKDTDAHWTRKNNKSFFGYKNHISVDVKYKFIRAYTVTSANVHDGNVFEELLDPESTSKDVWADSAYRSQDAIESLQANGYREHLQRKGSRGCKLTKWEQQGNRTRSRIRSRVEHIFGVQTQRAGNMILRGVGIIHSGTKIGLRNLAFNLDRYGGKIQRVGSLFEISSKNDSYVVRGNLKSLFFKVPLNQNRSKTAISLDISRSTLIRKLKQYDLKQSPTRYN